MQSNGRRENTEENLTFGEKSAIRFHQTAKNITIEPIVAVHAFADGLVCITVPSLYFDKICRVAIPF